MANTKNKITSILSSVAFVSGVFSVPGIVNAQTTHHNHKSNTNNATYMKQGDDALDPFEEVSKQIKFATDIFGLVGKIEDEASNLIKVPLTIADTIFDDVFGDSLKGNSLGISLGTLNLSTNSYNVGIKSFDSFDKFANVPSTITKIGTALAGDPFVGSGVIEDFSGIFSIASSASTSASSFGSPLSFSNSSGSGASNSSYIGATSLSLGPISGSTAGAIKGTIQLIEVFAKIKSAIPIPGM